MRTPLVKMRIMRSVPGCSTAMYGGIRLHVPGFPLLPVPVAQRRTLCLHFDKRLHDKEVIDEFFLANGLKKAGGHSLEMEDRCFSGR